MRLAVWPVAPARALATALADLVTDIVEIEPHESRAALEAGGVDLALLPTLDVLRAHDGLEVVPGIGLVGERSPRRKLIVGSDLDKIETIGFDPRDSQEALLMQLVLREHYGSQATFALAPRGTALEDVLAKQSAALVDVDVAVPEGTFSLDPALEWLDLTLRPYPWGLLGALAGTVDAELARRLRAAVQMTPPTEALVSDGVGVYQLTLDGYAMDGLDLIAEYLFQTGTLLEVPAIPFIQIPDLEDEDDG